MPPLIGITTDISDGRLSLNEDYVRAVVKAGGLPVLIPPRPPLEKGGKKNIEEGVKDYARLIDGLLIPGGDDLHPSYYGEEPIYGAGMKFVASERSLFEISLIREIIALRKPLLGICYGMQVVNVALGGSLYQDIRLQINKALDHKESHEIHIEDGGPLRPGRYIVNSSHHQAVKSVDDPLSAFANSEDGVIEAFYMKDYPYLLGVQWHPEREPDGPLSDMIFRGFVEAARAS